jgi:polyisoprenoid-binding protein YceI
MTQLFARWASIFVALFIFSTAVQAAPETFTLDKNHSYVLWSIEHLGFSTQTGKWYATGQLVLDKDHPEQSKADISINVAGVITGLPELDKHLKSKLFFDVDQYPKATFVSDKVHVLGKDTGDVRGILTLRGISKPVVLHVIFNKSGINPITNKMTVGFSATTSLKRSDFGMNALLPALGDTVDLKIEVEASQDKKEG